MMMKSLSPLHSWASPTSRLEHFFRELKLYMNLQEQDSERLRQLHPVVAPHFGEIVDAFYEALWENPRTRAIFEGEQQVDRLRSSLDRWLHDLFEGPHDAAYVGRRHRIGRRHVDVGLLPHFMFGAMNIVRVNILVIIMGQEGVSQKVRMAQAVSMEKALDLELTIITQSYWDSLMELRLQVPAALTMGLAHEIRNPLNAINLNVTLMERRLRAMEEGETLLPLIEVMRSEIGRIRGLTSEIMDFAKPIQLAQREVDAEALAREMQLLHEPTMSAAGITWHAQVEPGLTLWCDPDRIRQVMMNLITNAVEALGEGGGQITCEMSRHDAMCEIVLSDDGEGVEPSMRYRIFDLFYTTKASGTGIGLTIVQKIVEAHEGTLTMRSRPGRGTSFSVYLPLAPGARS